MTGEGEAAYVYLICSLLSHVEFLPWLAEEFLVGIVRECVNIRFTYRSERTFTSELSIVADRMKTLELW